MEISEEGSMWEKSTSIDFWGEIAPCEHVVQIYEDDQAFLDLLSGFVSGGLKAGDGVIVIATAPHLLALESRLKEEGLNVFDLRLKDQYIPLNSDETLARFMINGWPDENLFNFVVTRVIARAKKNNRKVRAFGEMVATLWAQGHSGATVQLEHLWNRFCEKESFSLFCAYPKAGFTQDAHESIMHICGSHSRLVGNVDNSRTEIMYKSVDQKNVGQKLAS